ncbi:phenylacetate--CoA ligase family protein [Thermodesulfatator autotrophicus]|uniref:Phenylacetate-coenzyme A ligase n=1 Tax=Thermodesulfatator autotrophicus TaxID=1795632 RepID=A0A177EC41_9BACT|nr:phenylacetate--CoA ligase [Thermodesulfatator autotrophicus]OAG28569.1 phenylacetate--CoA ligase [Thermodesulfatator autotrophicus]
MDWYKKDFLPREDLEAIQLKRLKDTVERVYHLVPFYRKKFDEIGLKPQHIKSLDDLKNLPFTTKQDLRDNYPFGLFAAPMDQIVRIHSSSGTTGKPTVVGYTENDLRVWTEVMYRTYKMANVGPGDVVHNAYGYGLFTGGLGFHYGAEAVGAAVVPSSVGFTKRQLMLLKDFGATILCCTPSYALHLAEVAREEGFDPPKDFLLRAGFFGAEPASEGLRQAVAEAWGIKYFEAYGLSEIIGPGVAASCPEGELHIFEDHFIPEIINPETGEVLPEGQEGELVFTTLSKQGLPIIRYRTKDIASLYKAPCKCGRTVLRMGRIVGRTDDMLIVSGVNVFPSQVEHVLTQVEGLTPNYVIVVDKRGVLDVLEVWVEVDERVFTGDIGSLENLKRKLEEELANALFLRARVKLVEPKTLERSMGKAKRVVDRRELKDIA